jgi:hypothetical protein
MNSAPSAESTRLSPATAGFALAAAITILFNTALAWAKDSSPKPTAFMTSLTGHHWTTHGLADLALFAGLGLFFARSNIGRTWAARPVIGKLTAAVVAGAAGLALWFAFV